MQKLLAFHEKQRDIKELVRTDTGSRNFKYWLKTRGNAYARTPWGTRLLADPGVPLHTSQGNKTSHTNYVYPMRLSGRYSEEEVQAFQDAWEAMLWDEVYRIEYVTIRDEVEQAIEATGHHE